jgi:glycosyltransferase involved in cell wall biosynthesis
VHVIASGAPGRTPLAPSVRLHTVAVPEYPLLAHAPYEMAVAGTIVDVASAYGIDVLNVHYAVPHAASAYMACRVLGADAPRCVVTLHGTDVTRVGLEPSIRGHHPLRHQRRRSGHRSVAVPARRRGRAPRRRRGAAHRRAAQLRRHHRLRAGAVGLRARRHRCAVRRRDRRADADTRLELPPGEAHRRLIELLARVRRSVPARLVLVGDGPDRAALAAQVTARGLGDQVRLLGPVADLPALLRHADAFVLTSESESFGVAALEALSSGVPVFAYRVGGLPEVVAPTAAPWSNRSTSTPWPRRSSRRCATRRDCRHCESRARDAATRFARAAALDRYEACFRGVL